ncbi:glycoside hydrolase family 113 [Falsihalocynthiibacter arcticus]|uniref:Glycosidase-like protein n=1 Tax=Falsihalocynthiibacter arcticus TaxID=1579316 RepID=A0A126V415_9RHOB|nr:hypothetical protein [Falsihalocynthiibacter arcticus]AML53062.1 hypothetical protein RC74_18980 [Falsihalocynthiibacter arcticus]
MVTRRIFLGTLGAVSIAPVRRSLADSLRPTWLKGFNLIETKNAPFGSAAAEQSIRQLASTGATAAAVIPFLWQSSHESNDIVMGDALPGDRIAAGITQLHAAGLAAIVKPHVWVPGSWAGGIELDDGLVDSWYSAYRQILLNISRTAEDQNAEVLVIGTELRGMSASNHWEKIIGDVRASFSGKLTYVAHGADEAEQVDFWPLLDAVAVSLYPILGADHAYADWDKAIAEELDRVEAVARKYGKPVWIAEIGIRSAKGAAERPWESAEERIAQSDMALQAEVLDHWFAELSERDIQDIWVWRWLTDPDGGGAEDTDFTVQNKTAEGLITQWWNKG